VFVSSLANTTAEFPEAAVVVVVAAGGNKKKRKKQRKNQKEFLWASICFKLRNALYGHTLTSTRTANIHKRIPMSKCELFDMNQIVKRKGNSNPTKY
jgi:hypothetical protein